MTDARLAQTVVETLSAPASDARLAQTVVETLSAPASDARLAQTVVEVLSDATAAAPWVDVRLSQTVVEVIAENFQGGVVTQAVVLALYAPPTEGRVTQGAALALYERSVDGDVTQVTALSLVELMVDARITQTPVLVLYRDKDCHTRECQCWKITRKDGDVFAYTTHDQSVTYLGVTYIPCRSLRATAALNTATSGASSGDLQAQGIIDDAGISERDLYVGLFDDARIDVFLVDWETGEAQPFSRGLVGRVRQIDGTSYEMTARTGGARLEQQPLLNTFSPACYYEFGDSNCKFNVEAQRIYSDVTAVPARNVVRQSRRRQFQDAARTEDVAVYRNARIRWETGNNTGVIVEVKDIVSGLVTLWYPLPFDVEVGDQYSIVPGCGKTKEACQSYDNYINFGGFPDLPGSDELEEVPTRSQS